MPTALIIVDVQNDFCPGGSLAVAGGDAVAGRISEWIRSERQRYALVVATMDWHPQPRPETAFAHFSDDPNYVDTWPPHCVQDTFGAQLHPNLSLPDGAVVVRKGQTAAAYSGFEGSDEHGTALAEILRRDGIDAVDVAGLATDYCVKATAIDAGALGWPVRVLGDMVAGVAAESSARALVEMRANGIVIA